jgi:hypothetical protein
MHTPGSPTAKSLDAAAAALNAVMPVAWVLVAVLVPVVGLVHVPAAGAAGEKRWTMKFAVFAPPSRSLATNVKVALKLVAVQTPDLVSVQ